MSGDVKLADTKAIVKGKIGCVRYVAEVTMPKVHPPPPRNAQNKSGYWKEFVVMKDPSARTIVN